ncbi:hypothetical protein OS493_009003 [Desmophyllum pertusum]|uniref:Uncharacterized protein n=1 Tax=Desmophyllum pertusum TaxID=174260 RepID=A0A9W9ZF60_9CNID|nr:hypothetical protein OS493_009003 [Desmophyllum pertusum]
MMAENAFVRLASLAVITVFLHLPRFTSGIHSPQNVKIDAINGTDFLILSWDYQAGANYSKIGVGWYSKYTHSEVGVGPTLAPCNSTKCSYCVYDRRHHTSCHTFNPIYTNSLSIRLDYAAIVTYRVAACSTNESNSCVYAMRRDYTIPPGAPSAVRNVHARPFSSKSVEITWTAPNQTRGTIVTYTVYYKTSDGERKHLLVPPDRYNESKVILSGLKTKTTYTIWMIASTGKKNGEESEKTSVTTYENECESSPCQNNGKCKATGDSYECLTCPATMEGKNCESKYSPNIIELVTAGVYF